jgi:hypothetical protein
LINPFELEIKDTTDTIMYVLLSILTGELSVAVIGYDVDLYCLIFSIMVKRLIL